MFCKKCGTKNDPANIYCINDGVLLREMDFNLLKSSSDNKFCSNCGENKSFNHIYCTNCGYSFYDEEKDISIDEKKDMVSASMDAMKHMGKRLESMDLTNLAKMEGKSFNISNFIYSGIGIIIGLIFSFIFAEKVNTIVTAFVFSDFNMDGFMPRLNVLNSLDTFLIMNVAKLNILLDISGENFIPGVFIKGGSLALMMIPMISFTILGIFKSNKELRENGKIDLKSFLTNGLIYGVFIAFLAIIRGRSNSIQLPGDFLESMIEITLTRKYSILTSFINSFILYSMASIIGCGISIYMNREEEICPIASNILAGGRIFGIVSLITIFIGFISISLLEKSGGDFFTDSFASLFKLQTTGIFLSFINMGVYTHTSMGEEKILLNAFSNSLADINLQGSYLFMFLGLMILIFLLFFIHGRRSKEIGDDKFFIGPIVYGLFVFIFSSLQKLSYSYGVSMDSLETNEVINIAGARLLIGGIIIGLAAALVGYLVTGEVAEDE